VDISALGVPSEGGRSKANMSWIFLKIPPGNLLEICLIKFVDTLFCFLRKGILAKFQNNRIHRFATYTVPFLIVKDLTIYVNSEVKQLTCVWLREIHKNESN